MAGPSSSEILKLGNAVTGFVGTVAEKIDDAEAASEYNNGLEVLRRGLTDFDLSLAQDPDWRSYPEKAAKKENDLWTQVDKTVKHQGAKNQLQSKWQEMREDHYARIGSISNEVRIRQYAGDLAARADGRLQDVLDGKISSAEATSRNEADYKMSADSGVITPLDAYNTTKRLQYETETAEATRTVRELARAQGWDAAINQIPTLLSGYDTLRYPGEVDRFITSMERLRDYDEKQKAIKDQHVNTEYDAKWENAYADWLQNKPDVSVNKLFSMAQDPQGFTTSKLGDQYRIANIQRINSELERRASDARAEKREARAEAKQQEYVNQQDAIDIVKDPDMSAAMKDLKLKQLANERGAGDKELSAWRSKVKNSKEFNDLLAEVGAMARKGADGSNPIINLQSAKKVQDALQSLYDKDTNETIPSLKQKLTGLVDGVKKEEADDIIRSLVSSAQMAGPRQQSNITRLPDTEKHPSTPAVKLPVATKASIVRNGVTYYEGEDGKTYQVGSDGKIYVWDGKAWQTVK